MKSKPTAAFGGQRADNPDRISTILSTRIDSALLPWHYSRWAAEQIPKPVKGVEMGESREYEIRTDIPYDPLETIDLPAVVDACDHDWFNQSLGRVNDSVVRLGIFKGEFHFHKHDREDEFFLVLDGKLLIDFEGRSVELTEHQGMLVPRGVVHRTRSPERSVVLMIEGATVVPTGDD